MRVTLSFLSDEEISRIHAASLRILAQTGIRVYSDRIRALLVKKGAKSDGLVVKIPPSLVEEAVGNVNREVILGARVEGRQLRLPAADVPFVSPNGYVPFVTDPDTGARRSSTSKDLEEFATVCDYLDAVDFFWPIVFPTDVSADLEDLYSLAISLRHTVKHVQCSCRNEKMARWQVRLTESLRGPGGQWPFSAIVAPVSPLTFESDTSDAMMVLAEAGVPVVPMTMASAATTAPVTLAGNMAEANAEQLAALVMVKSVNPQAPFIYGSDAVPAHMMTGAINFRAPEYLIMAVGLSQLARFYRLPACVVGICMETVPTDLSSFERNVFRAAMGMMNRSDLIPWLGSLDSVLSTSLVQVVLDAEASQHARAYLRGFDVSEDTLALDVIDEVGPGGHFLTRRHTLDNFMKELWTVDTGTSVLLGHMKPGTYIERAKAKIEQILGSHRAPSIDEDTERTMEKILEQATRDITGN